MADNDAADVPRYAGFSRFELELEVGLNGHPPLSVPPTNLS